MDPQPECEPSSLHISAMHDRVVTRNDTPYAELSLLAPHHKRLQRSLKMRAFHQLPNGTYVPTEVKGPPSFDAWYACFRVYRVLLLMLRHPPPPGSPEGTASKLVVSSAALEQYLEHFRALVQEFPECWSTIATAEDRCRSEQFP
eukprot:6471942-Amphidinium_carterae.1